MNKETLIAIFLGFTGGILVAFLLITVPKKLSQGQNDNTTPTPTPQVAETENASTITLNTPDEGSIIQGKETNIEGVTVPNAKVVISGPTEDLVLESDDSGSFSSTVSVYEGYNHINVTVFTINSQTLTMSRNVFATVETL